MRSGPGRSLWSLEALSPFAATPMLYRLDLVFQGLPASVTARTPGRLRDPRGARRPGRVPSPPPTVPRPPELPLSARAVDPQLRAVHRLPSSSPSKPAKMEDMPSPRESETHRPG